MYLFKKTLKNNIDFNAIPSHIAIILDGNGRWANKRGIPRNAGHRKGAENLKKITAYCSEIGIKYLTVYAFSTENWRRPKEEVNGIMNLLKEFLKGYQNELKEKNIKINILGDINSLPTDIKNEIINVENLTSKNDAIVLNVAFNYGGRAEIINAVKKILSDVRRENIKEDKITEELFSQYLYTNNIPDPELLIRTSGEYRLSNFLLWQSAYSEILFDDVLWPDFSKEHLLKAIYEYQKRERRFGGL